MKHLFFVSLRKSNLLIITVVLLDLLLFGSVEADAVTITVNSTADVIADDGQCTLREAITAANRDVVYGDCPAGSGDDIITLPAGTYTLARSGYNENDNATGDLDINSPVTINGADTGSTIIQAGTNTANGIDRVFNVHSSGNLTLDGVTIRHGKVDGYGGGLYNYGGKVTLVNSIISGNTASKYGGGLDNLYGTVTIGNSTISGNTCGYNGGGVSNYEGTVTIANSTLSDNRAVENGGGLYNYLGTITMANSTIAGNSSDQGGGGLYNIGTVTIANSTITGNTCGNYHDGGGLYHSSGLLAIGNSTISRNTSGYNGGGVFNTGDTVTIVNSTLSGNISGDYGGGLYTTDGTVEITHSTITENNCDDDNDLDGKGGGIYSSGTAAVTMKSSIVSRNWKNKRTHDDCSTYYGGTISDGGYNLVGRYSGCPGEDSAPLVAPCSTPWPTTTATPGPTPPG